MAGMVRAVALGLWLASVAADTAGGEWGGFLSTEGAFNDNIRSQEGPLRREEFFWILGGGVGWVQSRNIYLPAEVSVLAKGRVFSEISEFNYCEVRPRAAFDFGRTELELEYWLTPDRLFFDRSEDVGPLGVFYTGHAFVGELSHKFGKRKQLRTYLSWDFEWRDFADPDSERDDLTAIGEASMRYRVSRWFVPELGFEYGERRANRDNFDRDQWSVAAGFESKPVKWLSIKLKYDYSRRDYTVDSERTDTGRRNRNFGRDDDVHDAEVTVTVPLPQIEGVSVRARYHYRGAESSRPGRTYTQNEVGIELRYSLAGIRW